MAVSINEIVVSTTGTDPEFLELIGTPDDSLTDLTLLRVLPGGEISRAIDLSGAMGTNGYFLLASPTAEATFGVTADQQMGDNTFTNSSSTYLLVSNFTGLVDDDIDLNDDGVIDSASWSGIVDSVAVIDATSPIIYSANVLGPDGTFLAPGGYRDPAETGDFALHAFSDFSAYTPTAGTDTGGDLYTDRFIWEIQGDGAAVTAPGELVRIEGVVTAVYPDLKGFYIQEEDSDADGDSATSDAIFVFTGNTDLSTFSAGQIVSVEGTAGEFFNNSQITASSDGLTIVDAGDNLNQVSETVIARAEYGLNSDAAAFEAVEGMLVQFSDPLVVSEYFELARFGEIVTYAGEERPLQYTQTNTPDAEGYAAYQEELEGLRVILDDTTNAQNIDDVFYPAPDGFAVDNTVRGGDVAYDVTGVMEYSFGEWKLRPVEADPTEFTTIIPRAEAPEDVGGSIQVATFNVLNYFTTIDDGVAVTATGLEPRGANSLAELERQTDKIVSALMALDSDIVSLIEIENDDDTSLATLVDALNTALGEDRYDYVATGVIGGDAIKVGFIYDMTSVKIADGTAVAILDEASFLDPLGSGSPQNRPAVAVTFEDLSTGGQFTAVNNHFKSKGSTTGVEGDDRPETGEGSAAGTREAAADILADWLAANPTGTTDSDVLILGDLNSYAMEGPIAELESEGYTNLLAEYQGLDAYSYLFDGQLGTLDYAMANDTLLGQVTGATAWNINADEVPLLDYNDTIQDPGERSFETKPTANELYAPDAYRSSDHDPLVVGLQLEPEFVFVTGTDKRDFLAGTSANEVFATGDKTDTVTTGGGRDVIDLSQEAATDKVDITFVTDFDVALDAVAGFTREDIAREENEDGRTILTFDTGDKLLLDGVLSSADITFTDAFVF